MFGINNLFDALISVLLAAAGGLSRLLYNKDKTKLKLSKIFSELFIACFIGVMFFLATLALKLDSVWPGIVCGAAGWCGPQAFNFLLKLVSKKTGINLEDDKDKKD